MTAAVAPEPATPGEPISLTDIRGIRTARQRQLIAAGISSVQNPTVANIEEVRRALAGVSDATAREMIDDPVAASGSRSLKG